MEIQGFAGSNLAGGGALTGLTKDFNNFLQLLIAQLRNQDPTEPLDSNEFTQLVVSFTEVEQNVQTNNLLQAQIDLETSNQISSAANYIGKEVEVKNNLLYVTEDQAEADFAYILTSPVEESIITIRDAKGHLVHQSKGSSSSGRHNIRWDRKDADGRPLPAGIYSVSVLAKTSGGKEYSPADIFVTGAVEAVNLGNKDLITLVVNGFEIPISDVFYLSAPSEKTSSGDAPVITDFEGETLFKPGDGEVAVDNSISIFDRDGATLTGATVRLEDIFDREEAEEGEEGTPLEYLKIMSALPDGISVEKDADGNPIMEGGTLRLKGLASIEAYRKVIESIVYNNTSKDPNLKNRTVIVEVDDGRNLSNIARRTIKFINDEE